MFNYISTKYPPLWRLRKRAWYRALQHQLDFSVAIKSGYIRFFVMFLRDFSLVVNRKELEVETHKIFEKLLLHFPLSHVLDIGSNVGVFAWHALDLNHNLKVFLFEPDSRNIQLLKKTIKHNRLNNVTLWEGVVSDRIGKIEFLVDGVSGATGSIKDESANSGTLHNAYQMSNRIFVSCTRIDDYMQSVFIDKASALIKIDVEGAELEVINGAILFIKKYRPFIIVECFNINNLEPLVKAEYISYPLAENCNYFLIPREAELIFNKDVKWNKL